MMKTKNTRTIRGKAFVFYLLSFISYLSFAAGAEFNYRDRVSNQELWGGRDVTMRFEFYSAPDVTATLLFTTNMSVDVASDGVFCAEVGVRDGLFATTNDRYVAVYVPAAAGKDPSVLLHGRRRKLMSVPTAIYAQDASEASGDFVVRGTAKLLGDYCLGPNNIVDREGRLTVTQLDAKDVSCDNGNFMNQVSVGGSLTLTKSLSMNDEGGRTFTGESTTLVVRGFEAEEFGMSNSAGLTVPKGLIMMWYGEASKVPAGWAICDGNNGTPKLTGRFIVGAGRSSNSSQASDGGQPYSKDAYGGARSVTLTSTQIPKHDHTFFGDDQLTVGAEKTVDRSGYDAYSVKDGDSAMFKTGETGANKAHENRPPFKAVYYIMKIR